MAEITRKLALNTHRKFFSLLSPLQRVLVSWGPFIYKVTGGLGEFMEVTRKILVH